jgi:hypothetical protein
MTFEEFTREYERLCFGFRVEFNEGEVLAYFDILRGYSKEQMRIASLRIMENHRYFPKIAEIVEEIHEIPSQTGIIDLQLKSGDKLPTDEERREYMGKLREMLSQVGNPKE